MVQYLWLIVIHSAKGILSMGIWILAACMYIYIYRISNIKYQISYIIYIYIKLSFNIYHIKVHISYIIYHISYMHIFAAMVWKCWKLPPSNSAAPHLLALGEAPHLGISGVALWRTKPYRCIQSLDIGKIVFLFSWHITVVVVVIIIITIIVIIKTLVTVLQFSHFVKNTPRPKWCW